MKNDYLDAVTGGLIVNYRELLKKYIGHVAGCEGVSFIGPRYMPNEFTDEEWEELQRLDEELLEEEKRQRAGRKRADPAAEKGR